MNHFIYVPLRPEEIYHTTVKYAGQKLHQYGLMKKWWKHPANVRALSLAFTSDMQPVGAAILLKKAEEFTHVKYNFGVYVKRDYRGNGIGGHLVSSLRFMTDEFYCDNTSQRKIDFFTKYLDGKNVQ